MSTTEPVRLVARGAPISLADATLRSIVRRGETVTLTLSLWDESPVAIEIDSVHAVEEILAGDVDRIVRRTPPSSDRLVARVRAALESDAQLAVYELVDAHDRVGLRLVTGAEATLVCRRPTIEVEVREVSERDFAAYAEVPIAFEVEEVLELGDGSTLPASPFAAVPVAAPYHKDYDAISGSHPTDWPRRFDVAQWGVYVALHQGRRVGGVVIAVGPEGVDLLEGRDDLALIWDLRVAPDARGRGVATALMRAAADWARARGCVELAVETQQVNVAACRFYAARGFTLGRVDPDAYPELPDDVQLLWYRRLSAS